LAQGRLLPHPLCSARVRGHSLGAMGQVWSEVCEPKVTNVVETVEEPDHPGASRVPYALMQGYYGSVCKMLRGGESTGTGWLINLADLPMVAQTLQDPKTQAIVTARSCCPTKESAVSIEALFDYVDESAPGHRCVLDPKTFFFSGLGKSDYVICALRDVQDAGRKPVKLGLSLSDDQLPAGATITVVSHPGGLPREVSHGQITRVDEGAIYYNAGAKAAMGSAVFFAYKRDLHVIAMGLKGADTEGHEVQGVRCARFREVFYDDSQAGKATMVPSAAAGPTAAAGPMESGSATSFKMVDVKDMQIKLNNGQAVTYTGSLKAPANAPQGSGSAVYDHGVTYSGEWKNGMRHGPGKITKEKEGYYSTGECEDDLFIGTWTKYKMADDTFLEEQHYDHTTMDSVRRHLGMQPRKAVPQEESPVKQ